MSEDTDCNIANYATPRPILCSKFCDCLKEGTEELFSSLLYFRWIAFQVFLW